ncbi:selenocysteine-specific translation elongation factor [Pseudonocardia acaciae]|uniref:selenocysteine-specific translation elongation factor n=1 Tax=Pseudonocardia acaciae TaxID=551276 RepID=UPI0004920E49|nr:selenocysteine-specific translation elongation factor [Pseudonocardia acaciae]
MHVIATAGHVDHGKSTLVRALTGMEPDRWAEERRRGMTIDLGFAWTGLPSGETVAFVDVPGHERFVGTMLAGVGPVPAVMFVVAADEGWMPQSTEHLDALAALGAGHGLLVITRSDLMEPELARDEAREHLAGTPLADMKAVCVSGATGAGLDELRAALDELVARLPAPDPDADVRLWVDRAFTIRGAGTVVTGTLAGGRIAVDDELLLEPGGRRVGVRGLQSLGESVPAATGVARVAVNLRGLPRQTVGRGDVLVTPGRWLTTDVVDVRLHAGAEPAGELPEQLSLHIGAAAVPVRARPLGSGGRPHGDTARLTLRTALPLRVGDRALLRDPGRHRITAGLTVLDVRPPPLARRGAAARRAAVLNGMTGGPDAVGEVARRGLVRAAELAAMGALDARELDRDARVVRAGDWLLDREHAVALADRLLASVAAHDAADPLDPGLPLGAARRLLDLPETRLVEALLDLPPAAGQLVSRDGRVRRASDDPADALPAALRAALAEVRAGLEVDRFAAPDANRLAELGLGPKQLATLVRAGELTKITDGVYLLPGAEHAAAEVLTGLGDREFTLSEARQALGTSRRVAVPLLERLARLGLTRRTPDGNHRLTH